MSHNLHQARLWWERDRGGAATANCVRVPLHGHLQPVPGLSSDLILVSYSPEVHAAYLQERTAAKRDMTSDEIAACERFLRKHCLMEGA